MKASIYTACAAALLLVGALAGCAAPSSPQPWPATIVSVDQMKMLTPLRIKFIHTSEEKSGLLTTVLVVHVDADGKAVRSRVEQSSGHARVDEAAKLALLDTRFAPYVKDGVAEAVSVVMPMHVPVRKL